MSGPKGALAGAWTNLRQKMNIEDPKPLGVFLGCDHKQYTRKLPNGKAVRCIEYDYESFLVSSLDVYKISRNAMYSSLICTTSEIPF